MTTLINAGSKLTATAFYNGKGGTEIVVLADTVEVGKAVLGGKYSPAQAINEFRKSPAKFSKGVPVDYTKLLKQLNIL